MNWCVFWAVLAATCLLVVMTAWWADHNTLVGKLRIACAHDPAEVVRYHGDAAILKKHRWVCTNCGLGTPAVSGPQGWERRYGEGREKA